MFLGSKKNKKNNYKKTLRKFVKKNYFIKDSFSDSDSFFENGIIDSTGVLELVSFIEDKYDIQVEDEELIPENLDSIDNLSNFLKSKHGDAG
jgi:acyl carrier protein